MNINVKLTQIIQSIFSETDEKNTADQVIGFDHYWPKEDMY